MQLPESEKVPFAAEILVNDLNRSLSFYQDVLNFDLIRQDEADDFAALGYKEAILMIKQKAVEGPRGSGVILRFYLPSGLKDYHDKVARSGADITKPYAVMDYGLERFYVTDPDGYQLKFSQGTSK